MLRRFDRFRVDETAAALRERRESKDEPLQRLASRIYDGDGDGVDRVRFEQRLERVERLLDVRRDVGVPRLRGARPRMVPKFRHDIQERAPR